MDVTYQVPPEPGSIHRGLGSLTSHDQVNKRRNLYIFHQCPRLFVDGGSGFLATRDRSWGIERRA
jgi:hypothetical protein